jgi:hypothetical protein
VRHHARHPGRAPLILYFSSAWAGEPEVSGTVGANLHFGTDTCEVASAGDCRFLELRDLLVAGLAARGDLSEGVSWRLETVARLGTGTAVVEAGDASDVQRVQPVTLEVPQAVVRLRDVLPGVDLGIGQQRFAWGTTDGMQPLDVVNPYDLRDPTRFDRRLGIPALAATATRGTASLDVVYVPLFRPARLPDEIDLLDDAEELFDFSDVGGGDVELGTLETRTDVPDPRAGFAAIAARASWGAPFADLSDVFWRGRDSLPQAGGEARLVGFATGTDRVDVGLPVVSPTMTVAGAGARGELVAEIVGSAELAVVLPQRTVVTAPRAQLEALVDLGVLDELPDPLPETVTQDGEPYARWVVGLDRLIGRFALAGQWIHGLPTERTASGIGDYGALAAVVTLSDPVQLRLLAVSDLEGWLASGELAVLHADAATLTVGVTQAGGSGTLGDLQPVSRLSLGVEAAF